MSDAAREPDPSPEDKPHGDLSPGRATDHETAASSNETERSGSVPQARSAALFVAAGIFLSRIIGFVRERAVGYFFGVSEHADVWRAALRLPNLLQNLLGEGTISAAFIPIYSRMLEEGRPEDAGRFAGAVLGLLTVLVTALVAIGVVFAEPITTVLAPGFLADAARVQTGDIAVDRFALAVQAVRLTLPMAGILVLSAWALGILNSHRKFFLPYVAPVIWNVAILSGLAYGAMTFLDDPAGLSDADVVPVATLNRLLFAGFWGALVGGLLQFAVQLPAVIRVLRGFRPSLSTRVEGVRQAMRAFGPVVAGRGVYQLSGYLDLFLATFIAAGAIAAIANAQVLYMLPVSLFAMSVAASELPELSRLTRADHGVFLERVNRSVRQIAYLVVPSAVGFIGFGFLAVAALYQTGQFRLEDTWLVYFVLAAYSIGLVATTTSRLLQNAFYALDDTKTPAKIAVVRVVVSAALGAGLMFWLDQFAVPEVVGIPETGRPLRLGAVGLALGASVGAWAELAALRIALGRSLEGFTLPWGRIAMMFGLAGLAAIPAALVRAFTTADAVPIWLYGSGILGLYGVAYLVLGAVFKFEESEPWVGRLTRRFKRKK